MRSTVQTAHPSGAARLASLLAAALAGVDLVVSLGMALLGNPEGIVGAVLFFVMFGVPALALALALRRPHWGRATGWTALVLAFLYAFIVTINLSGYSAGQAALVAAIMIPTVAVDLAIFTICVVRR